ncbi:MAG: hypothetical protein LM573_02860 [Thermofilum sp.]|nr:hypothetical protein [Thermofilum sp.]
MVKTTMIAIVLEGGPIATPDCVVNMGQCCINCQFCRPVLDQVSVANTK